MTTASYCVRTISGTTHVLLRGDLDLHHQDLTEAVVAEVFTSGADDVVLDLQEVGFMDSTGVCALLSLAHTVRRRAGRVRLRNASDQELFLLDVRGGLGLFDLPEHGDQVHHGAQFHYSERAAS